MAINLLCWSGGKDSSAGAVFCHDLGIKIDEVIMADVYFDLKRGISNELPLHFNWCHNVAAPKIEDMGYKVSFIHGNKDYLSCFNHVIRRATSEPEHNGMTYGFPLYPPRCDVRRDCKQRPLDSYINSIRRRTREEVIVYDGICSDEPERVEKSFRAGRIPILAKYGIKEAEAREMARSSGLLSPVYSLDDMLKEKYGIVGDGPKCCRGGCFNCPCQKDSESLYMKLNAPEVWNEYVALEDRKNLCYSDWNRFSPESLHERDRRLDNIIRNAKINAVNKPVESI